IVFMPSSLYLFVMSYDTQPSSVIISIAPATTEFYTLSLHDALPIFDPTRTTRLFEGDTNEILNWNDIKYPHFYDIREEIRAQFRSEEHTSELQSRFDLVCRLLLEKK